MAQTINTNIASLTAQRNLATSQKEAATAMERLSSGLRINSAKDDAAGLAIASRLTSQINGLNQAVRNANDGISALQVAEGALQETTNMLQRMRELAVQSSNASNTSSDRTAIQTEVAALRDEFDRIATTTSFAGKNLLNGGFTAQTFQVGDDVGETIAVSISSARSTDIGTTFTAAQATLLDAFQGTTTAGASNSVAAQTLSFTVGGERTDVSIALAASAQSLASSISSEVAGVTATASNTASITMAETHTYTAGIGSTSTTSHASDTYSVTVDGSVVLSATTIDVTGQATSALTASTVVSNLTSHASYSASNLEITSSNGVMSITDKMGGVVDIVFASGGNGSGGAASVSQFTDNGFLAGGTADQFTVGGTTVTVNNSGASSADDMAANLQAQLAANTAISAEITATNTASTVSATSNY